MKKILIVLTALICAAMLASCGGDSGSSGSTSDEASAVRSGNSESVIKVDDKKVKGVETPYAVIKVPEVFEGAVTDKVTSEEPYTLEFSAKDGTKLFALIFNENKGVLLGTIEGEKENTVLYAEIAELDQKSPNYAQYSEYQEGLGTITSHLKEDYDFAENIALEKEDDSTFDIKTDIVTLKYPKRWEKKVDVKTSKDAVSFSSDGVKLFDICFTVIDDGIEIGSYNNTPVYLVSYEFGKKGLTEDRIEELRSMQDDANVIFDNLYIDSNFKKK